MRETEPAQEKKESRREIAKEREKKKKEERRERYSARVVHEQERWEIHTNRPANISLRLRVLVTSNWSLESSISSTGTSLILSWHPLVSLLQIRYYLSLFRLGFDFSFYFCKSCFRCGCLLGLSPSIVFSRSLSSSSRVRRFRTVLPVQS